MRPIFDESVPRDLKRHLAQHGCDVAAFPNAWKGMKNGELLSHLEDQGYDCLVTTDKNLMSQQKLAGRKLGVVVLPFQDLPHLVAIAGLVADAVRACAFRRRFDRAARPGP